MTTSDKSISGPMLPRSWVIASIVVAIGSIFTLFIVLRVTDADALAGLALALAVISFAAQLIVTLADRSSREGQAQRLDDLERRLEVSLGRIEAAVGADVATTAEIQRLITSDVLDSIDRTAQAIVQQSSGSDRGAAEEIADQFRTATRRDLDKGVLSAQTELVSLLHATDMTKPGSISFAHGRISWLGPDGAAYDASWFMPINDVTDVQHAIDAAGPEHEGHRALVATGPVAHDHILTAERAGLSVLLTPIRVDDLARFMRSESQEAE